MILVSVGMFMNVMVAVFHAVNDRTGCHEQERLEEGMCNQVEGCGDVCTDAQGRHHKTKLRNGGVRQHLLDIVLGNGNGRGEECCE